MIDTIQEIMDIEETITTHLDPGETVKTDSDAKIGIATIEGLHIEMIDTEMIEEADMSIRIDVRKVIGAMVRMTMVNFSIEKKKNPWILQVQQINVNPRLIDFPRMETEIIIKGQIGIESRISSRTMGRRHL
jgi:hypothetical protein